MNKYIRIILAIILGMIIDSSVHAEEEPVTELIASTYAQFAMSSYIHYVSVGDWDAPEKLLVATVRDVQVISFGDGANIILGDVVSPPEGMVLISSVGRWRLRSGDTCPVTAVAGWRKSSARYTGTSTIDWKMPLRELSLGLRVKWIAKYTVEVHYEGKEVSYRAFAFVLDDVSETKVQIYDYVLDGSAVGAYQGLSVEKCMVALGKWVPPQHHDRIVRFGAANSVGQNCTEVPETGLCCDTLTQRCGIRTPHASSGESAPR